MTVLLPVDSEDRHKAQLCSIEENKTWALISLDEGQITSCIFYKTREDILDCIESIVVINEQEYIWPFMQEGIIVLIAPFQRSIDEVIEAFLFKELHDLTI